MLPLPHSISRRQQLRSNQISTLPSRTNNLTFKSIMGQSLFTSYLHITFSTKNRAPVLKDQAFRKELYAYMAGVSKQLDGPALIINGVEDHVHLLIKQCKTKSISDYMRELKKTSSLWINQHPAQSGFHWQDGYGAFSISPSHVEAVTQYIANQEEHHKKTTFKDELLRLLQKYQTDYNETYLWS